MWVMTLVYPPHTLRLAQIVSGCAVGWDMTTKGDKQATKSALERNGRAPSDDRRVGVSADPEVPSFISEILAQYKDLLVQHVETVKNKAVTEVKEEALLLHSQAELRLRSMESDVQQGVQAVLDRAREAIFEMVRAEMGDIFEEWESRLQALLDTGESEEPADDLEADEDPAEGHSALESLLEGAREPEDGEEDQEGAPDSGERDVSHADVRLELPPPLDPRRLLGFYRGLSATKDIRILRALGSLDKGVNLYIRPKELSSVTDLLRDLPGVDDVTEGAQHIEEEDGGTTSTDPQLTLKISLAAAGKR